MLNLFRHSEEADLERILAQHAVASATSDDAGSHEKQFRDLLQKLKFHRSFDRAFELSLGMSQNKFDEEFQSWLKKTYWPAVREFLTAG